MLNKQMIDEANVEMILEAIKGWPEELASNFFAENKNNLNLYDIPSETPDGWYYINVVKGIIKNDDGDVVYEADEETMKYFDNLKNEIQQVIEEN